MTKLQSLVIIDITDTGYLLNFHSFATLKLCRLRSSFAFCFVCDTPGDVPIIDDSEVCLQVTVRNITCFTHSRLFYVLREIVFLISRANHFANAGFKWT